MNRTQARTTRAVRPMHQTRLPAKAVLGPLSVIAAVAKIGRAADLASPGCYRHKHSRSPSPLPSPCFSLFFGRQMMPGSLALWLCVRTDLNAFDKIHVSFGGGTFSESFLSRNPSFSHVQVYPEQPSLSLSHLSLALWLPAPTGPAGLVSQPCPVACPSSLLEQSHVRLFFSRFSSGYMWLSVQQTLHSAPGSQSALGLKAIIAA
mmetsp:Transcript_66265/g.138384  ORF Transcript_66265/g.138384 Transcript_66265/m.138384 type:complete len:205 (+) Transcript_66265:1520-2134(+)